MLTFVLGALFLGLKAYEYYTDYEEGLIPTTATLVETVAVKNENGRNGLRTSIRSASSRRPSSKCSNTRSTTRTGVNPYRVQLFFLFYYCMTGLHVLHMVVGLGLLIWQYILAKTGFFDHPERYVYIEVMSLYWHFVDMVWMFLLPLLYFAGPHGFGEFSDLFGGGAH